MEPITATITFLGLVIGIIAGTVQVLDYVEKRREKRLEIQRVQNLQPTQESVVTFPLLGQPEVAIPRLKPPQDAKPRQDWGEAFEISVFYGRTEELAKLEQWILTLPVLKQRGF